MMDVDLVLYLISLTCAYVGQRDSWSGTLEAYKQRAISSTALSLKENKA
jgi:hypothetical protein